MSLLTDIKFFTKKYLKNPVLVAAASYMLYKYINTHMKKEGMAESVKLVKKSQKGEIIYDDSIKKYIFIDPHNHEVFSHADIKALETLL